MSQKICEVCKEKPATVFEAGRRYCVDCFLKMKESEKR